MDIISLPEWQPKFLKRGLLGESLLGVVHAILTPRYFDKFSDAGMSPEFAKAVWLCYKAGGTDLSEILSLAEQRAFLRNLDTRRPSDVLKEVDDDENNWDFERRLSAEDVATTGIRRELLEVQPDCKNRGESVSKTIVDVFLLVRECIENETQEGDKV